MADFDAAIVAESARFLTALEGAAPTAAVPTCPDWRADDLLWHLGEVQDFWARIVRQGLIGPGATEGAGPSRPERRDELFAFFRRAHDDLRQALSSLDDATPAWNWSDADHTVGFIRRRQAHEALIHRVDAELVVDRRTPMDPGLCADGVDEVLQVMYGGAPTWGRFTPGGRVVRVEATDVGRSWLVALGRFAGNNPDADGAAVDVPDIHVVADGVAEASISGTAADLDCWLWHRPAVGAIQFAGDAGIIEGFTSIVAAPID